MEIEFRQEDRRTPRRQQQPPGEQRPLDWHGLRARFNAAHAARRAMAEAGSGDCSGSFDQTSALALGAYVHVLLDVNRTVSPDVKRVQANDATVAGASITGDRGPR